MKSPYPSKFKYDIEKIQIKFVNFTPNPMTSHNLPWFPMTSHDFPMVSPPWFHLRRSKVPQGALHPDLREEFLGILRHLHILFLWRANIEMGGTWRYHIQPTNKLNKPTNQQWLDGLIIMS